MEENEERGISLGEIFKVIFSQKWLALILVAAITLIGTVCMYFYGKRQVVYSVPFVLQLPRTGDETSTSYQYPDGEIFYFTDMVSLETLRQITGREEFKSIKVDEIINQGDISITRTIDRLDEGSTTGVYDLNYTIKVKAKYFKDAEEARAFIEALVSIPSTHIKNMELNYDNGLEASKAAITYQDQLESLKNQTQYIRTAYEDFIKACPSGFVLSDGRTLSQCKSEVDLYLSQDLFTALQIKAEKNRYVKTNDKNSQEMLRYQSELDSKTLRKEEAEATYERLVNLQGSGQAVIYDQIIALAREIAELEQDMQILEEYKASFDNPEKVANAEFEAEVKKVEDTVARFTAEIKPIALEVYGKVTKVNYLNTNVIGAEGGMGLVKSLLISLVVGLVVALIVAYIVGRYKIRKYLNANEGSAVPAYDEAQLQLAVANGAEKAEKAEEKAEKDLPEEKDEK